MNSTRSTSAGSGRGGGTGKGKSGLPGLGRVLRGVWGVPRGASVTGTTRRRAGRGIAEEREGDERSLGRKDGWKRAVRVAGTQRLGK